MKKIIFLLLFTFAVSACGTNKPPVEKEKKEKKSFTKKESITFKTEDNLDIKGLYFYNETSQSEKQPLVILIHQFNSNKEQWKSDFIDSLIAIKYKVLTYDIRSHGESDKAKIEFNKLLTEKEQAPKDLEAVFKWAKTQIGIDSTRIGIIGTSIGASLGMYAKYYLNAKVLVGVSGGKGTFEGLTGIRDIMMGRVVQRLKNVLFICGDKDGDYAKEEKDLFDNYLDEPREMKIYNAEEHGKDLINKFPEINKLMIDWLNKYL